MNYLTSPSYPRLHWECFVDHPRFGYELIGLRMHQRYVVAGIRLAEAKMLCTVMNREWIDIFGSDVGSSDVCDNELEKKFREGEWYFGEIRIIVAGFDPIRFGKDDFSFYLYVSSYEHMSMSK